MKFNWNENPNLYFQKQKQNMKKEEAREGIICRYIWTCVSSQDVLWARNGKIVKLDWYNVLVTRFHQRIKSAFNSAPLGFVLSQKFKEKNYFDIYAKQFVASINCTIIFIFLSTVQKKHKTEEAFQTSSKQNKLEQYPVMIPIVPTANSIQNRCSYCVVINIYLGNSHIHTMV